MPKLIKKIAKVRAFNKIDPSSSILFAKATAVDYKILLWLAEDPEMLDDITNLAGVVGCTIDEAKNSINFWIQQGEITVVDENVETRKQNAGTIYLSSDIEKIIRLRPELQRLVQSIELILDKSLSDEDIYIIIRMLDRLSLSETYIVKMVSHCATIEIKTIKKIWQFALKLQIKNIISEDDLDRELSSSKTGFDFQKEVQKMFHAEFRKLTAKEKKMIQTWYEYGYDIGVVQIAYDATIKAIEKPLISYANAIIERWHTQGLTSPYQIAQSYKQHSPAESEIKLGNSFNVDDFFEAALRKSYRESRRFNQENQKKDKSQKDE